MRRVLYSLYDDTLYGTIEKFVQNNSLQRYASAMKYRKKVDRFNSLMSYVLLCLAVGKGVGDLIIGRNGKPSLSVEFKNLYFSISHTQSLVATAISDSPIGIDIEENSNVTAELISMVSTNGEIRPLGNRPLALLWTAKEAMSKLVNEDYYSAPHTSLVINGEELIDESHPSIVLEYRNCSTHTFCLASLIREEISIECVDKFQVIEFLKNI